MGGGTSADTLPYVPFVILNRRVKVLTLSSTIPDDTQNALK